MGPNAQDRIVTLISGMVPFVSAPPSSLTPLVLHLTLPFRLSARLLDQSVSTMPMESPFPLFSSFPNRFITHNESIILNCCSYGILQLTQSLDRLHVSIALSCLILLARNLVLSPKFQARKHPRPMTVSDITQYSEGNTSDIYYRFVFHLDPFAITVPISRYSAFSSQENCNRLAVCCQTPLRGLGQCNRRQWFCLRYVIFKSKSFDPICKQLFYLSPPTLNAYN